MHNISIQKRNTKVASHSFLSHMLNASNSSIGIFKFPLLIKIIENKPKFSGFMSTTKIKGAPVSEIDKRIQKYNEKGNTKSMKVISPYKQTKTEQKFKKSLYKLVYQETSKSQFELIFIQHMSLSLSQLENLTLKKID